MSPSRLEAYTRPAWRPPRTHLNRRCRPSVLRGQLVSVRRVSIASWPVSSGCRDADGFDHVAQVARSVPERLHRLRLAYVADRAHLQLVRAGGQPDRQLPLAEGVFPQVLAEAGLRPGFPAVGGDGDVLDAVTAVECDALERDLRAGLQLRAVGHAGDERAYLEAVDRNGGFWGCSGLHAIAVVVGDAIRGLHPKSVEDVVDDRDLVEVLHPIGAVIARDDEAKRKPV